MLACYLPIMAFVTSGFEHSVANMYFIPEALFIASNDGWLASLTSVPDVSGLTWSGFLVDNLLPVTIGNLIGGTVMVAALYWFVYLRPDRAALRA